MNHDESLRQYRARLQAAHGDKRPLIEQVNNHWTTEKADHVFGEEAAEDLRELGFCDLDNEGSCPNTVYRLCTSRRLQKMFIYVLVALLVGYYIWIRRVQPHLGEEWAYKEGFVLQENGTYGIARGGDLDPDLTRLKRLHDTLIPGGSSDPEGKKRLVFVGDVHGCKKELSRLLEKVGFEEGADHLVLTGDVISKGPDNVGVLDELIRLNATSVRGNHEDRILHIARSVDAKQSPPTKATSSKGVAKDVALLKQLKPHHLDYLRGMPLMLHIPAFPQALPPTRHIKSPIRESIVVVHAGLVPGVSLDKQDPYFVMNMRSINRRSHVPDVARQGKDSKPWFDLWNWYNDHLFSSMGTPVSKTSASKSRSRFREEKSDGWVKFLSQAFSGPQIGRLRPRTIIYGHDSKAGLQIHRWSKGLDSGCVNGDELTAMVLDAKGRTQLYSVGCETYRE